MRSFRSFHLGKPGAHPLKWLYAVPAAFFGLFYHSLAGLYDAITNAISMGLWKQWLAAVQPYLPGECILEIGHGTGHLQEILAKEGLKIYGLEPSRQMVRLAARRLHSSGCTPHLARGFGESIPYKNNAFDQVVTTFPAEFITEPDTLSEIQRVLRPNGRLVILRFAWLSSERWPYKTTAWLFQLVGEAPARDQALPEESLDAPFREADFSVSIEQIDLGHSGLVIFCCQLKGKSKDVTHKLNNT
jgi:ubiquinone/menaquinone biosynthesis C-methylase UbiE